MKITEVTKRNLRYRREKRDMEKKGYELISCSSGIGNLWQLDRGSRIGMKITEARVSADGLGVWVKVGQAT